MCYLFDKVIYRVFTLILKSMLHSKALNLLWTQLPVRLLAIRLLVIGLSCRVCILLLRLGLRIRLGLLDLWLAV